MDLRKIKDNKIAIWSILGIALLYLIVKAREGGDFNVFLEASDAMKAHKPIYDLWLRGCKYYYSPLFVVILVPFTYLPYFVADFLWLCLNVFFLVRTWKIVTSKINLSSFTSKQYNVFFLLIFALTFRLLLLNFDTVQMTVYLLWVMLECNEMFEKGKNIKGALLLALAINIKVMPIVIIPYLLLRKKFVPVLWTMLFFVIFLY